MFFFGAKYDAGGGGGKVRRGIFESSLLTVVSISPRLLHHRTDAYLQNYENDKSHFYLVNSFSQAEKKHRNCDSLL